MNADAVSTYSELSNLSEAYMLLIAKNNQRIPEITTIEWWPQTAREIINTRVRDKKRLEKVGNLVKNSYLYRWKSI